MIMSSRSFYYFVLAFIRTTRGETRAVGRLGVLFILHSKCTSELAAAMFIIFEQTNSFSSSDRYIMYMS